MFNLTSFINQYKCYNLLLMTCYKTPLDVLCICLVNKWFKNARQDAIVECVQNVSKLLL